MESIIIVQGLEMHQRLCSWDGWTGHAGFLWSAARGPLGWRLTEDEWMYVARPVLASSMERIASASGAGASNATSSAPTVRFTEIGTGADEPTSSETKKVG